VSLWSTQIWAVHLMKIQRPMFYSFPNRYEPLRSRHVAVQSQPQSASPVKLVKIDLDFEIQISDFCCIL
jgi:hypothetical protein